MVLGLRSKSRKCVSVQVEYLVCVQQIKPWPSGQSKSPQFLLIQWENGDQSSGSFRCSVGEGKIEMGESFKLPVTLYREASKKRSTHESYQKNILEFQLYESLRDRTVKGQLWGSAAINLAEYGVSRETVNISTSVNCKKSLRNAGQPPLLYVSIEPLHRDSSSSSPNVGLSKEGSLEKGESGSVSALGHDGDDEVEISSFTDDDDVSTHSSQVVSSAASDTAGASLPQKDEEDAEKLKKGKATTNREDLPLSSTESLDRKIHNHKSDTSLKGMQGQQEFSTNYRRSLEQHTAANESIASEDARKKSTPELHDTYARSTSQNYKNTWMPNRISPQEAASSDELTGGHSSEKDENGHQENGHSSQTSKAVKHLSEDELLILDTSRRAASKQLTLRKGALGDQSNIAKSNALKRAKSTFLPSATSENAELINSHTLLQPVGRKAASSSVTSSRASNNEAKLESKVAMLEEELREAAALEVSLYSVVAEHGSSSNKIHSPARRLSRFYFHACQTNSPAKRASAARAVVSGLALVSKACGNDVPRLTFWLSNAIVLRAIATSAAKKSKFNGNGELHTKSSPGKSGRADDWENPQIFTLALERVEAWMFSRIVESVWWQTMTPHMQSSAAKGSNSRKSHGKKHILGDAEQGSHSIELWKKAFKDACERLCPVRAGGHDCACLSLLARLVMEQLVSRLDVAMFNAILRESADEMPTDPVSDPITDSKVLPIPAGKSGFGAGAQLKNAIGSWSRWLGDLFGIDEDDSHVEPNGDNRNQDSDSSSKAFHLLNALSDLMMLPFEMLADRSTRREVCPAFGVPLIKRVLYNFVPDDFCPEPVPQQVLEALDAEDDPDADNESISNIPYIASPTQYTPPPAATLYSTIGSSQSLSQSESSVLRKSYTSDDELDELDSPIASIVLDNGRVSPASDPPDWMLKGKGGRKVVRYQLLREVWKDGK
ncbi:uncharacterized protein LOC116210752 [Punica granatum]|uniref:Uncharacterized protein LOC116210752 n=2 Tax=Punica granatum TaxID=22663 RepID=A0A6P8E5I6_PUNGR|nr:uncharacterized protein LOC116210752 [Punica granatum]XP_031400645.1 uncharacterized protein LOC116210752 [Punica granatum]XP_031400646.1 uncharacterized protein LOC116210752 [Punica granatum]